jgi:ABC-2 type transport system permease protein
MQGTWGRAQVGIRSIVRKEVVEHLGSKRFPLLFALILLSGLATAYFGVQSVAQTGVKETEQEIAFLRLLSGATGSPLPSFVYFVGLFGPIIGIALSFDSINREIASGSMLKMLSNPIRRDNVIVGKIAAGLLVILLLISCATSLVVGFTMLIAGFGPGIEGAFRIIYFVFASFLYIGFWFGIGLLFSIIFRRTTTSALACISLWVFFTIFVYWIIDIIAIEVAGLRYYFPSPPLAAYVQYLEIIEALSRISPLTLYAEAASALLNPEIRSLSIFYYYAENLPTPQPLSLDLSIALAWPSFSALIAAFTVILTLNIITFMRAEIRPAWA